ncbi:bifunctional (p)ppGpp synthetase/guanosine-3',5'-bis(diphosphate) 3'-pyrophosphohydrolase [Gammaproteobacteria bacterium]|nr:bifunctional (p)ppGpp synthetase/guanosine-3',5'-bis(diphosphate) 3'-pyrophosphohydrolase [Gammaproteobacteria bacterium]
MDALYNTLEKKIDYLNAQQVQIIHQAFLFAENAHRPQKRASGDPYIIHPVSVACLLADMKLDYLSIVAGLLHDVIEDTPITKNDILNHFGEVVANLVDGLSKLENLVFTSIQDKQAQNFRKMVMAMASDIRVIIIKLADRLHNMRTLGALAPAKKKRIATETLEIYAPIAKRLGMHDIALELEDLGFLGRYPTRYRVIKEAAGQVQGRHKQVLNEIKNTFQQKMIQANIPFSTIVGREKHIYSVYRKMKSKRLPFSDLTDVYGFRILVEQADQCYRALGVVHGAYKPVPACFKDYIALPKPNGYQSIHTVLFGPHGVPMEVQIRTKEMDDMANFGIAAHWLYKVNDEGGLDAIKQHAWLKGLLEIQKRTGSSEEFLENVKIDLFPDEVYVFTPKGDVIELPTGSSVLDLAYAIHTDVGHQSVVAKVDRQFAPLSAQLKSGQMVEIITSQTNRPTDNWLDIVKTSKAKIAIRQFLRTQHKQSMVVLGGRILTKAISQGDLGQLSDQHWHDILMKLEVKSKDQVLQEIALGVRSAQEVISLCQEYQQEPHDVEQRLKIKGSEGMAIEYAGCCMPIPGDQINGILRVGRGIIVHQSGCSHLLKAMRSKPQVVAVEWASYVVGEYRVDLRVEVLNQRGVLAMMALAVSDAKANIDDIVVENHTDQQAVVLLKLKVTDKTQLASVSRRIKRIALVMSVERSLS